MHVSESAWQLSNSNVEISGNFIPKHDISNMKS